MAQTKEEQLNLFQKLLKIQAELKAPKGQYNSFGKYKYRSLEDINESVKPLNEKHGVLVTIKDEVEAIGNRIYIVAIVTAIDVDNPADTYEVKAYAREEETKKGMDGAQITGSASSYARKYAMNALYLIDDTKDPDTDEQRNVTNAKSQQTQGQSNKQDPNLAGKQNFLAEKAPLFEKFGMSKGTFYAGLGKRLGKEDAIEAPLSEILETTKRWLKELENESGNQTNK